MSEKSTSLCNSDTSPTQQNISPHAPYLGDFGKFCDGRDDNLSDKQLHAIELTVQGYPDIRIAEMLDIDRRTLYHWKTHNDDYRRHLQTSREQIHTRVADRYHDLLTRAWGVIEENLIEGSENNRFRAAQSLLHMAGAFQSRAMKTISIEDNRPLRPLPQVEYVAPILPPKIE